MAFGLFWKHHFSAKTAFANISGKFFKQLGYFLFQHLVTLPVSQHEQMRKGKARERERERERERGRMGEVKSERCQTFFVASSLKGEYGRMSHAQNPSQGVQLDRPSWRPNNGSKGQS